MKGDLVFRVCSPAGHNKSVEFEGFDAEKNFLGEFVVRLVCGDVTGEYPHFNRTFTFRVQLSSSNASHVFLDMTELLILTSAFDSEDCKEPGPWRSGAAVLSMWTRMPTSASRDL
ncbi:hypothetical protein BHM03_00005890 [Ensete ventricosum]|nr:hypothetical protein BHM03_00005890 [Ensete ventricosum]